MKHYNTFKKLIGLFCLMGLLAPLSGQVSVHSSDFNVSQGEEFITDGNIGASQWVVTRSGDDWGARIHNNILELTNTSSAAENANGWVFARLNTSGFDAPFNPMLGANAQPVSWYFNMRQIRSNPAGFGSNSYGVAFIVATNNASPATNGSGYAVVLGNSGTPDPIRFVKFEGGIQSLETSAEGLIIATAPLDDPASNHISMKVIFDPSVGVWELWGRNDESAFEDPLSGEMVLLGSVTDTEFTNIVLNYSGAYWQGSFAGNQTAFFDNVSVWAGGEGNIPPSIDNIVQNPQEGISPETPVSVSVDVSAGDAPVAGVELQWGLSSEDLNNSINMSLAEGVTYSTDAPIPAQPHNTHVFYRIEATDQNDEIALSPIISYLVLDPDIDLVITGVVNPTDITVDYGTLFEELPLPDSLTVNLDNGEDVQLPVLWQAGDYDPQTAGFYLLSGDLVLAEGVVNPDEIEASVGITVLDEIFIPDNIVVGWDFPASDLGANLGIEENIGKPISREAGFEGSYSFSTGVETNSVSTTGWESGADTKYYTVEFSSLGYISLSLSSAQRSSNTGPRDFKVQYRVAQDDWQDVPLSTIIVDNSFTSGVIEQLALPEEMDNKASVSLRWIMTSNTSVNSGEVASTGTSRIDNIFVGGMESGFEANVEFVEDIDDIIVEQGTAFEEIALPDSVMVFLDNYQAVQMEVTWQSGDYNPEVLGTYNITGALTLPEGVTNDDNVVAQLNIVVVDEIVVLNIVSVQVIDQVIIVEQGTPFGEIELPTQVEVMLDNDSATELEVNWLQGDYDADVPGYYELEGELVLVTGIENPDNLMAEITVEVIEEAQEAVLAGWTFSGNTQQADQGIESNIGKLISRESGYEGSYNYPAGASGNSISTNQWMEGDGNKFWMVELSTLGYGELNISSKQRSSGTGPRDFFLQYRIGTSGNWIDIENSQITVGDDFISGVLNELELPAACNNKPLLFVRWIMNSNTSVNEEEVASTGTSRIDEILVKGMFSSGFKRIVTGVEDIASLTVETGTSFNDLDLPETVTVIFDDMGTENLPVQWLQGDYDGTQPGSYLLLGELELTAEMENPDNIMAQLTVEVVPEILIFSVTFNVDMGNAPGFDPENDQVLISGSMFDFAIPGTLPDEQTMSPAGDMIYTITMELQQGEHTYKYYINEGIENPEPGADRNILVLSDTIFHDYWGVTNINDLALPDVRLFPNPAKDHINLSSGVEILEITLSNLQGVTLLRKEGVYDPYRLSVAHIPSGIYILRLKTPQGYHVEKILISR